MHGILGPRGHEASSSGEAHRNHVLLATALVGAVAALALFLHGVAWWYAPLALPALLVAHALVLGGLFVAGRSPYARKADAAREEGSEVLHRPRLYDGLVRGITLGREGRLRRWMVDLADPATGDSVLDVGSGTGSLLLAVGERVGPSGVLHGVEPSPEMAARAREKAEARGVPLEVVEGSAASLPFPDAFFDAVFCTLVLHHLAPPLRESAIREMRRVLRAGGRLVLVDWQRPRSLLKALLSPMFLTYFLHNLRPGGSPLDALEVEARVRELGFADVSRASYGNSGIGAIVGRLSP